MGKGVNSSWKRVYTSLQELTPTDRGGKNWKWQILSPESLLIRLKYTFIIVIFLFTYS